MSASNAAETSILALIFNATAWADLAQNDGSSPATQLYVALHTADPGDGGTQATSEANYTGYGRAAVDRDSSGWTVSGPTASNTDIVTWGACSAGSSLVTHFSIGVGSSGATAIIVSGALTASLDITVGITPQAGAGDLTISID